MTQPEALRLAGELAAEIERTVAVDMLHHNAAAELRRLHQFAEDQIGRATAAEAALQMTKATHAANEALREANEAFGKRQEWWNEKMFTIEQQRDALLEALKSTGLFLHHCWCDVQMNDYSFEKLNRQMAVVYAAIAKAEGEES